jgi:hypothetical protein
MSALFRENFLETIYSALKAALYERRTFEDRLNPSDRN